MTSDGFTKLFNSIISSSIWSEDDKTRILWITILASTDQDGFCAAAVPGLAAMARMSIEDVQKSLAKLEGPDPYSRTMTDEGRRLARVDGGWLVINHGMYRDRERKEKRREYMRELMAHKRLLAANTANNMLTHANSSASVSVSGSFSARGDARGAADRSAGGWTLDECRRAAESIGMPPDMVEAFYHHYDAQGWVRGNGQAIRSLSSALASWKASQAEREAQGKPVKEYQGRV